MHDLLLPREPNDLPLFQDEQRALEGVARVPLLRDELAHKALIASAPADGQPAADLLLDTPHLLVERAARKAISRPSGDGIHRRELEEPDRFLDVVVLHHGRERELRERLGDADDRFELTVRALLTESVKGKSTKEERREFTGW